MLASEWRFLRQHKMIVAVLLMIAIIPAIYCYLYLSSMWNTYGHVDNIPVAVVNRDRPVTTNGHRLTLGQTLTHQLTHSASLDFKALSETTAHRRLKRGQLYMVLTIPKDFSENAATLLTRRPKTLRLHYDLNSGTNFIVSKITTGMTTSITANINRAVTQTDTQVLLNTLHKTTIGMQTAATGSQQLVQGGAALTAGTLKMQRATSSANNAGLTTGLTAIQTGLNRLTIGAETSQQALAQGSRHLQVIHTQSANAVAIARPVTADIHDIASVPNNGTGMAPFAIAIGLYVGGIALGTMYDGRRTYRQPTLAITWWGSKAAIIGGVAVIQSLLLYATLRQMNGLTVRSQLGLFATILIGSLLFLSLIFCLRLLLGGFGTWLISIVLVAQLASSGGFYPLPLISPVAKFLNPWLPMTYLIQLLRSAISTNLSLPGAWIMTIAMTVGFNLLIILKFHLVLKRHPLTDQTL